MLGTSDRSNEFQGVAVHPALLGAEGLPPRRRIAARVIILALALLLSFAGSVSTARANERLSQRYKDWLEKEVVYIISKEERDAFLKLTRDEDREKFIEQFWEIRNPTPGSPVNAYKDEHYRRIEYANAYFKNEWTAEGWKSDRGKIYTILGPPGSRQFFTSGGQIYPIELWFYSGRDEPALPPFFYVMFYQKDGFGDFRLYSPYIDGPDKLVRAAGVENNRKNGWTFLHDFNAELARASLSLIPREPTDINGPPSLSSDAMLMKVINLANDRFHKERIGLQRRLREEVKVRITPDLQALKAVALPLRNPLGEEFIHYSLQIDEPQNYTLGSFKDKYFLNLEVQVRVMDAHKKLIYEATRQAVTYYTEKELAEVRARPLSFEDRFPVTPANYELDFLLFNRVTRVYYRANASVRVEPRVVSSLTLGRPLLVRHCEPAASNDIPFAVSGGTHCSLQARAEIPVGARSAMSLLVPVYLEPAAREVSGSPLKVQYTIGRLDGSVKSQVTEDRLDRSRFDQFGTLLVGKSVPVQNLSPGAYLFSVQVTDPANGKTAGTTLPFKLQGDLLAPPNLLTSAAGPLADENNGNNDFWRGLCALAQNSSEQAFTFFNRALERNPEHDRARMQLAKLYYSRGEFAKVASLLAAGGITKGTDLETALDFVSSLEKTGQLSKAIQTSEQAVALLEPAPQLYEQMAGLYEKAGQGSKARQARDEAHRLAEQKKQIKGESK